MDMLLSIPVSQPEWLSSHHGLIRSRSSRIGPKASSTIDPHGYHHAGYGWSGDHSKLREQGENGIVIVITGHVDLSSAQEAMKLGAYEYISKPFSLNTLKKVLQNGLSEWSKDPASSESKVDLSRYEQPAPEQNVVLANNLKLPRDRQRLLVVDDSELTIGLMTKELTSRGYEIISSKNAEKATQMILRSDTRPEVVLVDVNMPNINGAQFCRFIKSNSLFAGVKVVLCSTMPTDELEALATSYGADGFIAKDDLFASWQLPQLM